MISSFIWIYISIPVSYLDKVSTVCSEYDANIVEVSQSVLQDMFAMIMLVELGKKNFGELSSTLEKLGDENNLKIHSMHEDIFNSMHKI